VLPHVIGRVGLLTGFCLILCFLNDYVLRRYDEELLQLNELGHSVMGVALGMLIVFRTNTSYSRFWEARSHWGMIVNTSRNLVRAGAVYAPPAGDLARLVTAYAYALKEYLRGGRDLSELRPLVPGRLMEQLTGAGNPPVQIARVISDWVAGRQAQGRLDAMQAARMEGLVATLTDSQGGCEKILRTPLPFVYTALIKEVLLLYLATLPWVLVSKLGFAAPLAVAGISLGLLGIEEAGVEIEDPFGSGPNHLALDRICETIAKDTAALAADADGKLP
jgi:ion channel-forming bestrophin family protein